jgi:hypothetical protein
VPDDLEDALQSWMTPSGWKEGPPKLVTWGKRNAFFALSEYGKAKWSAGPGKNGSDAWPVFEETMEDWNAEPKFNWSNIAVRLVNREKPSRLTEHVVHCTRSYDFRPVRCRTG